jgi:hypothetical protein
VQVLHVRVKTKKRGAKAWLRCADGDAGGVGGCGGGDGDAGGVGGCGGGDGDAGGVGGCGGGDGDAGGVGGCGGGDGDAGGVGGCGGGDGDAGGVGGCIDQLGVQKSEQEKVQNSRPSRLATAAVLISGTARQRTRYRVCTVHTASRVVWWW